MGSVWLTVTVIVIRICSQQPTFIKMEPSVIQRLYQANTSRGFIIHSIAAVTKVQSDTIKWKSKQRSGRKILLHITTPSLTSSAIQSNCRSRNRETVRKGLRTGIGVYPRNERKVRVIVFNHPFMIYRLIDWKFSRWVCSFNCYSSQKTEERQKIVVRDQIGCDR